MTVEISINAVDILTQNDISLIESIDSKQISSAGLKCLYLQNAIIVRVIKSRRMRWAGHVASVGEGRGVYRVLVGRPEGKRPLGRPRHRWEDNIKMDLREIGIDGANWIQLAEVRVQWRTCVNTVMSLRVP
jgi:hypothetical protein